MKLKLIYYSLQNELMTPELTNGDNLFTEISARILEETYNGDRYLFDKISEIYF